MDDVPVFRASKRRKIFTKSTIHSDDDQAHTGNDRQDIVIVRRPAGVKISGINFSTLARSTRIDQDSEGSVMAMIAPVDEPSFGDLENRFVGAGSSTRVADIDRHMTDFVDRAMAKRSNPTTSLSKHDDETSRSSDESAASPEPERKANPTPFAESRKVVSAKQTSRPLSEVDLGPGVSNTNLQRTTAALTGQRKEEPSPKKARRMKIRIGRDGKPFRPRPRPRKVPDPEDLARGALVEEVLNEHGLTAYAEASRNEQKQRSAGLDEAADERMAEEFQQQFLDAAADRQERQQQRQAQSVRTKKEAATNEGPRLGGSRSARAKMAAAQSAAGSEKK